MKKEKIEKGKVAYDFEDDIFSARPLKRKYDSSVQMGNFIFDLDKKGRVNGFEILNASKLFGIPKLFLQNMVSGKMSIEVNNKFIRVEINLKSLIRNAHRLSVLNVERVRPEFIRPAELKFAVASS